MSEKNSNFGKTWTIVGRYQDFLDANRVRNQIKTPTVEAKIHSQASGFVVKSRELPKNEGAVDVPVLKKEKKEKKVK